MENKIMRWFLVLFTLLSVTAYTDDLAFQPKEKGVYAFNTPTVNGVLNAGKMPQGVVSLIDAKSKKEVVLPPGIMGYYRLMTTNDRWGTSFRQWPSQDQLLPDGSVQITWPPAEDHPVELIANYKWVGPNTLDLKTTVTSKRNLRRAEVFIGSYFSNDMNAFVYAKPTQHSPEKPSFIPARVNALLDGCYLAFPRNSMSAQLFFDGRWDKGNNPAHFSVTRFYDLPMAMRVDPKTKLGVLLMGRPETCFGVAMSYDKEPPDGVANHSSLYFSEFGVDLVPGQTVHSVHRMVIDYDITEAKALSFYEKYIKETE
jgi:hypothetical protein